ncbi:major facilitator superfamily transporter [Pseudovirgaria hyperparasitica]|uniref:Major facilitator superfamily transporter n=1 Tax=Pseudovirgaria hyperparasitica TaxID=470096 RepID=A0A6A6W4H3_9PEZI|nr:major facilitator superfamily transporter [Pseudovirgaria hyperparasitica]KAF2757455.1 major facilitator superfamily transporter [Pseudovirgaria hyperparasitica]
METTFEALINNGDLYRDGKLILMPAPSRDPKDPLNLSLKRKMIAVFCLTLFGALAASAELVLGAMLPVFSIYYSGHDPAYLLRAIDMNGGLPQGNNPLDALQLIPGSPPIWLIYLLASLPVLMIGIANLFFIPLAIATGRRPVVLITGVIAVGGALWAGFSGSLGQHLAARAIQGIGAGTVESLIPFIIQDMVHVHERNTWISACFAAQGVIIIALGIASPYMILELSWRYVYYVTAGAAGFFLVGCVFFLPETRFKRSMAEMNGTPRNDANVHYTPRTIWYDIAFKHGKMEWKKGAYALVDTLRTFFYPQIFFITMLNSAMIGAALAAGYCVAPALLTRPWSWKFHSIGLLLIPVLIAAILMGIITGVGGDWIANWSARARGRRVPENQLLNLIFPTICGIVGTVVFGISGENPDDYHWAVFLFGLALMAFGFLGANTVGAVYVLESYPHLAGPALVNIASFRALIAFVLSFRVSEWMIDFGYLNTMLIYTGIMAFFALLIPVVYIWGPAWRKRWPATKYGDAREINHT